MPVHLTHILMLVLTLCVIFNLPFIEYILQSNSGHHLFSAMPSKQRSLKLLDKLRMLKQHFLLSKEPSITETTSSGLKRCSGKFLASNCGFSRPKAAANTGLAMDGVHYVWA